VQRKVWRTIRGHLDLERGERSKEKELSSPSMGETRRKERGKLSMAL